MVQIWWSPQGAERKGSVESEQVTVDALKPPYHWVKVLSVRERGPLDFYVEALEASELKGCPGSDFELVDVASDFIPGGGLRGACFVCKRIFIQESPGDPVQPIDDFIEIITADALAQITS